jgi:transposase-like protein
MKALLPYLVDPTAARAYLESIRWPLATVCPHCRASGGAGRLEARPGRVRVGAWKCYRCKQQFTVTINTLFEDSKLPLHMWLQAMELLCRSRQGVSAQMLQANLEISYKSAWKLLERVRYAFPKRRAVTVATGQPRMESLYPLTVAEAVARMLETMPPRKHQTRLERAAKRAGV